MKSPTPKQIKAAREQAWMTMVQSAELAGYGAQPRWAELEAGRKEPRPLALLPASAADDVR